VNHPDPRIDALLRRLVSKRLAVIDLSLDRITSLLAALGNPERRIPPAVHVAGTNGKGSLVAYLTAIMQAAGYRVHRYTSPHLVRFNERIMVADNEIEDDQLMDALARVETIAESCPVTFFEATTAAAFLAFAETPADIVLLETGLGGRLDATNVVRSPLLTAITPVSMDHMDYLGDRLAGIAAEKAGIIKRGAVCVTGPQTPEVMPVLEEAARAAGARLFRFGQEWAAEARASGFHYRSSSRDTLFPEPNLAGPHQVANAGTAVACVERLKGFTVTDVHIAQGITHTNWPARLQSLTSGRLAVLMPKGCELWLDGGHNPAAGEVLAVWARVQKKPVHLVCGMLRNKDTAKFLAPLVPYARSLTAVRVEGEPQGQKAQAIAGIAASSGIKEVGIAQTDDFKSVIESIVIKEKNDFIILMCGSLYLAGNILWQNNQTA
jgi:dihydrofolate synthase/folylpolyglutamate synthase